MANVDRFENWPVYNGKLGFKLEKDRTAFRLWAPSATQAAVNFFEDGYFSQRHDRMYMTRKAEGVYELSVNRNLEGTYYTYTIVTGGVEYEFQDPYSVATGPNGKRSLIIDLRKTDPEGWDKDKAPEKQNENIIYELHVKDFTYQRFNGIKEENKGKYLGLTEKNTVLLNDSSQKTGLSYLKDLGVTHVQLMPVYDFASVDELGSDEHFNWGYDPDNFNVPEGSYSSDPIHGEVRIKELKSMIKALHDEGIRVIMDVVYNHTYHLDSCLFKSEPWYFYRQNADGSASNGSGCGNDIASERPMVHKYILSSVLYWAEEYHMDGFRFDLMGLLDTGLLNDIRAKLDERYGKGEKLMYGEPWGAAGTSVKEGFQLADRNALVLLDKNIGAFCDTTRDLIKGSNFESTASGFANGGSVDLNLLKHAVTGWSIGDWHFRTKAPSQTISYVSSHDDWCLWDKLTLTVDPKENFLGLEKTTLRANRFAAALYFTMQGSLFFLSGEECARTKIGIKNTYNSPLYINRFDWVRARKAKELVDYYKGLIRLRKSLPALYDKSEKAKERLKDFQILAKKTIKITLDNRGDSPYEEIVLFYFGDGNTSVKLEETYFKLLDGERSDYMDSKEEISGTLSSHGQEVVLLAR
ncbi:MAG TPA: type I pullulanase [Candidatus Ornithospirochaeta avicola]|uniref:Type I pullulanase n=1 Tax=Candidatus Ornithospirochaeta avicola TaxID=2840896 RepID=A0A9D1TMN3_9SPIO|nr:type I pullulanase [Candidatus Ornithospirochaeta avicola]